MTKGQLISICIKLLNENNSEQIDDTTVSNNPEFSDRTTVIVPSINRALLRLSELKKLPQSEYTVSYDEKYRNKPIKVNTDIVNDMVNINNIILMNEEEGYIQSNVSYFIEGKYLILPPLGREEHYVIFYEPPIEWVLEVDEDVTPLKYPDYVLNCIPYFVKADIFEEDNPTLANLARNIFETYASQIPVKNKSTMRGVIDVYSLY